MHVQATFMGCILLLTGIAVMYVVTRAKPVYLMNYHVYRPPARSASSQFLLKCPGQSPAFTPVDTTVQASLKTSCLLQ